MPSYSLTHLADAALLRDLTTLVAKDRITTAELLAHLAEVDARQLYLPAAYPSMFAYCVGELRLSEDCAAKRIQAARTARRCPGVFAAVADGRLHLAAVVLLSPHISPENAAELIAAAAQKTKAEIEALIAGRAPKLEMPAQVCAVELAAESAREHAPGHVDSHVPAPSGGDVRYQRPNVSACSAERYAIQATLSQAAHADLRHAQDLLAHQLRPGDLGAVLERALRALVEKLEHRKYAATSQPRAARSSKGGRHIPASVRRAVLARDGEGCTFTSDAGQRWSPRGSWSTTTSSRSRVAASQPSPTSACVVARTISTRPSVRTGRGSCGRSAKRQRSARPSGGGSRAAPRNSSPTSRPSDSARRRSAVRPSIAPRSQVRHSKTACEPRAGC